MMYLSKISWLEVRELLKRGFRRVILPVGTIEPHGTHLPLGTDAFIPEVIAERVAARTWAVVLPTVYYGVTKSLHGYPGSIRIEPSTLENFVYEILSSMAWHGFREAVILNGHGGSEQESALENAGRRLWLEHRVPVLIIDWWVLARERGLNKKYFSKEGGHAATDETAAIYAINPALVRKDLYSGDEITIYSRGVKGFPLGGTIINYSEEEGEVLFDEEKSKQYFEELVELVVNVINNYFEKIRGL